MKYTREELASRLNHTHTSPTATVEDIKQLCDEAVENGFLCVCIGNCHVKWVKEKYGDSLLISTGIDYPLGRGTTDARAAAAIDAVKKGAGKIDIMLNISMALSGDYDYVLKDLQTIVSAIKQEDPSVITLPLLDLSYFTFEQKVKVLEAVGKCGSDGLKTHGGYGPGSFRMSDVLIIQDVLGKDFRIKAGGDIEDAGMAMMALDMGVYEIGNTRDAILNIMNTYDNYIKYFE